MLVFLYGMGIDTLFRDFIVLGFVVMWGNIFYKKGTPHANFTLVGQRHTHYRP